MSNDERLARRFHDLYEQHAPRYGYETRDDTKEFDPDSNNGMLMMRACSEVVREETETLQRERDEAIKWAKYHSHGGSIAMGEEIKRLRTAIEEALERINMHSLHSSLSERDKCVDETEKILQDALKGEGE